MPLGEALEASKFDIVNYYNDAVKVNSHQPLYVRSNDSLFIQDLIVNKFTLAKLKGNIEEMKYLKMKNEEIEEANQRRWELI